MSHLRLGALLSWGDVLRIVALSEWPFLLRSFKGAAFWLGQKNTSRALHSSTPLAHGSFEHRRTTDTRAMRCLPGFRLSCARCRGEQRHLLGWT
eukprot:8460611-Pyramimonas_sp.AAC.1